MSQKWNVILVAISKEVFIILVVIAALPSTLGAISVTIPEELKVPLIKYSIMARVILAGIGIYLATKAGQFGGDFLKFTKTETTTAERPPIQGVNLP